MQNRELAPETKKCLFKIHKLMFKKITYGVQCFDVCNTVPV